jgi:hypothetical protein
MNGKSMLKIGITTVWLAVLGVLAISAQDKYNVKVPGGLAFSEFRGYEGWQAISISRNEKVVAMILDNPAMIDAYEAGIPGNGKPVPDGAKMAKIHWRPKPNQFFPDATVPGDLVNVDFMVKDSKRFADSGGWGYAVFDYNAASDTFTPGTAARERCQVRVRVSHECEGARLRFYGIREAVNQGQPGLLTAVLLRMVDGDRERPTY